MRIFLATHSHKYGLSFYPFKMNVPDPSPEWPGDWTPRIKYVQRLLEIEYEPERDENLEIECLSIEGDIKELPLPPEPVSVDWASIYEDGVCPDCGEPIPDDAQPEEACEVCEHVFHLPAATSE